MNVLKSNSTPPWISSVYINVFYSLSLYILIILISTNEIVPSLLVNTVWLKLNPIRYFVFVYNIHPSLFIHLFLSTFSFGIFRLSFLSVQGPMRKRWQKTEWGAIGKYKVFTNGIASLSVKLRLNIEENKWMNYGNSVPSLSFHRPSSLWWKQKVAFGNKITQLVEI